jgi:SAM-dependent methyltransferase
MTSFLSHNTLHSLILTAHSSGLNRKLARAIRASGNRTKICMVNSLHFAEIIHYINIAECVFITPPDPRHEQFDWFCGAVNSLLSNRDGVIFVVCQDEVILRIVSRDINSTGLLWAHLFHDGQPTTKLHNVLRTPLTKLASEQFSSVTYRLPRTLDLHQAMTANAYNKIATQFASVWVSHPPLHLMDRFCQLLPREAVLLDAGCGPGHHANVFNQRGHTVVGIDLAEEMLKLGRKINPRVRFELMNMMDLRFQDCAFDGVWCIASALHLSKECMSDLLAGFARVLKPRGVLALGLQVGRKSEITRDFRFFEYYRNGGEIAAIIKDCDFVVIDEDAGHTSRNTHENGITLNWQTYFLKKKPPDTSLLL